MGRIWEREKLHRKYTRTSRQKGTQMLHLGNAWGEAPGLDYAQIEASNPSFQ